MCVIYFSESCPWSIALCFPRTSELCISIIIMHYFSSSTLRAPIIHDAIAKCRCVCGWTSSSRVTSERGPSAGGALASQQPTHTGLKRLEGKYDNIHIFCLTTLRFNVTSLYYLSLNLEQLLKFEQVLHDDGKENSQKLSRVH